MITEKQYPNHDEVLNNPNNQIHQPLCPQCECDLQPWDLTSRCRRPRGTASQGTGSVPDGGTRSSKRLDKFPKVTAEVSSGNKRDTMSTYVEVGCMTNESNAVPHCPQEANADSEIKKRTWLEKYSRRLLDQWLRWQTPLGITYAYADQIREDLAEFYEDPLKRMFIEATYYSHLLDHGQY